jgi:hypothetical protein
LQRHLSDAAPKADQVFVVPLNLGLAASGARSADDDRHAFRHIQLGDDLFQTLAIGDASYFAGNAAAAGGVRHQYAISAGERQIRSKRRTLVAALLFRDLHQHYLAALDDLLNLVIPRREASTAALDVFIFVGDDCVSLGVLALAVVFGFALSGRLFREKPLAIGNRDLIIVGVNLIEGEKTVSIAAVLDEGGL